MDGIRDPVGRQDQIGSVGDAFQDPLLGTELVRVAPTAPDVLARDVGSDAEYRDGVRISLGDGSGRVGNPGAGRDQAYPRSPGGAGVAVRHERGALLVAGRDVFDAGGLPERPVELQGVGAGNAEHVANPVDPERFDQHLGAGHLRHLPG